MGTLQHPVLLAVMCPVCLFAKSMPAFTDVHHGYLCPSCAQRMLSLQHLCWPVCCCIVISQTLTAASQLCVVFAPTHLA